MAILRNIVLVGAAVIGLGTYLAGQPQRPGTIDDLLTEVRALRGDLKQAAAVGLRAQLVSARLTLQEARLTSLTQQLAAVRQQMADNQFRLAPFAEQLQQAQTTNSQILAPLRNIMDQVTRRDQELRSQESELARLIASEESRWSDFNARLDEMERALAAR